MGGNGSFVAHYGGILQRKRMYQEFVERLDKHKILIFKDGVQIKIPVNSNSKNTVYLCAVKVGKEEIVKIKSFGYYENNILVRSVDLKFDKGGNLIPFGGKNGSHSHLWPYDRDKNEVGRTSHDTANAFPLTAEDLALANKIVEFNKKQKKWLKR